MLQNEYVLAKIGADTAETGRTSQLKKTNFNFRSGLAAGRNRGSRSGRGRRGQGLQVAPADIVVRTCNPVPRGRRASQAVQSTFFW